MIQSIIKLLEVGLSLWLHKEKTKYQDKFIKLKAEWYAEINKPDSLIDDVKLADIEWELRVLADSFAAQVGVSLASTKA